MTYRTGLRLPDHGFVHNLAGQDRRLGSSRRHRSG